jgi:hypothetical protein
VKASNQNIQKNIVTRTKKIDDINRVMAALSDSIKNVPTRREMRQQAQRMEEQVAQVEEIKTGLSTTVEEFKLSNATERNPVDQQSVTPTRPPVP